MADWGLGAMNRSEPSRGKGRITTLFSASVKLNRAPGLKTPAGFSFAVGTTPVCTNAAFVAKGFMVTIDLPGVPRRRAPVQ
jgi:hypothetical protein